MATQRAIDETDIRHRIETAVAALEHIIRRGHGCGRRQNLIPCRHGVTLLKLARVTEPVDLQREVTPLLPPFQTARRRPISTGFYSSSAAIRRDPRIRGSLVAAVIQILNHDVEFNVQRSEN